MTFISNSICPRPLEHQTEWSSGSDLDLCLRGAQTSSGKGGILCKVLCEFPDSLQAYAGIVPLLCHDQFFPNCFQFIIHVSSCLVLYILDNESTVK
jgi:hypothetical protein